MVKRGVSPKSKLRRLNCMVCEAKLSQELRPPRHAGAGTAGTFGANAERYSKTAFILLTPAEELSSFVILNLPNSDVFLTWGPPQISLLTILSPLPIV